MGTPTAGVGKGASALDPTERLLRPPPTVVAIISAELGGLLWVVQASERKITPLARTFALQHSPAPDLAFSKPVFPHVASHVLLIMCINGVFM